ncbi:MAG: baseplate J/gp47 family protein [Desulfitobacteriaceae bacterium]|nr:baseplate J/gp47 family protein [Desulfitobacteriaceae bacterium]
MNNIPMIDPRKSEDILKAIKQKAQIYTPEWKYEPDAPDGGATLAELFSQLFGETIDRMNRVSYKHYIEFLNILEVSAQTITPATGMARFEMSAGSDRSVAIKRGTQLYCDRTEEQTEDKATRVVFETAKEFSATPAKLTGIYSINPRKDLIEELDFEQAPVRFFDPSVERNIQRHCFALSSRDVLNLVNAADITLSFENTNLGYLNEEYVSRLADPDFAQWSFFDGSKQLPFDQVFITDGKLRLIKDNDRPICPQELEGDPKNGEDQLWISCNMRSDGKTDEIVMNRIMLGSAYLNKHKQGIHIKPDLLYANDLSLDPGEGGYCFGSQLMPYACFYISSDEVFSKRGARVNIEFDLKTVVRQVGSDQEVFRYLFLGKYIVEKTDIPVPSPDPIFISRIAWEYWNGAGWTHLKVEGDLNPFQGGEGSFKKQISFQCPEDIAKSLQNSIEAYWIRARVVEVENAFSMYAHLLLPYVEAISLDFDYGGALKPAEMVYTENNCVKSLHDVPDLATVLRLFQPMRESVYGVYLAFDLPPAGYPLNLYIKIEGQSKTKRLLTIEYLTQDVKDDGVWRELKFNDRTEGLAEDGIISIYAPGNFKKSTLFGQEGYWLRIVDNNLQFVERIDSYPLVQKIIPNVVEIIQKETVLKEMFPIGLFEPNKEIILANRPVLECELWVNEFSDITQGEMTFLIENKPDCIDLQYNNAGHISEFWVKWESRDSFINSGSDSRHYKLDSSTGRITFGNGKNGKVPSPGKEANIWVDYSFGGGKKGNLPEGSIEGLIIGIPYVDRVTNLEMTCGGSDRHDLKTLEKVGPEKLRHHGRAVTTSDFESIVLEQFSEINDVKCVANYDRQGQQAWGYVTLVVMPNDIENRMYSLRLCKKIEHYLDNLVNCELLAGGRFAVVPAIVMKVSVTVSISVEDYDFAAEAEREISEAIGNYLNPRMADSYRLKIEETPTNRDFFRLLKGIKNVARVHEVILEGSYYDGNELKIVPLDIQFKLRYVVVTNGEHTVKIL